MAKENNDELEDKDLENKDDVVKGVNSSKKEVAGSAFATIAFVMIIMLLGKVTGLLRDSLRVSYMGTNSVASAFTAASTIPRNFLDFAFASAISSSFIPVFNSYIEKKSKKEAFKLANNFITIILLFSTILVVLMAIFRMEIVGALVGGFDEETRILTAELLLIMLPTIIITALAFSVTGILQALGEFNIPAMMSVVSNFIIIGYVILFFDKYGVYGLCFAFLLGWLTQLLIQIPSLIKRKYYYRPYINFRDSGIREIGKLALPVMISSWVLPINSIVSGRFASSFNPESGVAVLDAANTLYSVITGVFILSIANVIFPKLSRQTAMGDDKAFGKTMKGTIGTMIFIIVPLTVGIFVLSEPIISLMYEGKKFDYKSVIMTASALRYYSLGMLGMGLQTILSRGFYANKDGKTPLVTGVLAIGVNAGLSFVLVPIMGLSGLAAASSVSFLFTGLVMLIIMNRKYKFINGAMIFNTVIILAISVAMGLLVFYVDDIMKLHVGKITFTEKVLGLAASGFAGGIYYFIFCVSFAIPESLFLLEYVGKIFKRKK